ncbi:hypothetical protein AVEN_268981-1 [Araneus ventricosus]|uniref:Uncharacterized protein n=1 Tax=Araneus ventricosus TaxID=182803 RepID=A0A4Y2HJ42_ARAVE|nr:hypothetical protein AVEN_268981-1 [Araneus ventricosus]
MEVVTPPSQSRAAAEQWVFFKQAIHRSSKMEFLEHGKETPIVKVKNLSTMEQIIRNGEIQKNLKSKTQRSDSNLGPRCEVNGKTIVLPRLRPRVEATNETRKAESRVGGILRL